MSWKLTEKLFFFDPTIKVSTNSQWERYISMFEESGMEVYKTKGSVFFDTE